VGKMLQKEILDEVKEIHEEIKIIRDYEQRALATILDALANMSGKAQEE
jgi:hypothetical protein